MINSNDNIRYLLHSLSSRYETIEFLKEDPSYFIHKVNGENNQELISLIASSLSFGSRKLFFPKIRYFLDASDGDLYHWVLEKAFMDCLNNDDKCFYRMFSNNHMITFLLAIHEILKKYDNLISFISLNATKGTDSLKAIDVIKLFTDYFCSKEIGVPIIPKNTTSSCKRLCMMLRWLVRDNSPVDIGIWSNFIDKKTLIMPLDTHVVQEANKLGLMVGRNTSMSAALKLTKKMSEYFPDDPLCGDFALFGYGVNCVNR